MDSHKGTRWSVTFGRGNAAAALLDLLPVVPLLDRATDEDDDDDADEDREERQADFAGVETVGEEDDLPGAAGQLAEPSSPQKSGRTG